MTARAHLRTLVACLVAGLVAGLVALAGASGASALDAVLPAAPGMQSATDGGGGSRLLRVLDGGAAGQPQRAGPGKEARTPKGPVPGSGIAAPMAGSVIAGCPRDLLTRLLEGVAERQDMLSALAIEQEILKLCHERQLIVTGIFETEAQLRALRAPAKPAAENRSPAAVATIPSVVPQLNMVAAKPPASSTIARKPANAAPPAPSYGWFSIVGMTGDLRAGVTDGARVWFVREGDPLPGDVRVGRIAARPPGVQIEGSGGHALPYRARPGDGS